MGSHGEEAGEKRVCGVDAHSMGILGGWLGNLAIRPGSLRSRVAHLMCNAEGKGSHVLWQAFSMAQMATSSWPQSVQTRWVLRR
eukprot:173731-Chlamydomonas_euryale.AAC.2